MAEEVRIVLAARVGKESTGPGRTAVWLATRLDARLTVLYVATELATAAQVAANTGVDQERVRERMVREARDRAERWGREALGGLEFEVRVEKGDVAERVAAVAAELGAALVVTGTEARGAIRGMILGDTTREILRRTSCPVVVVPPGAERD